MKQNIQVFQDSSSLWERFLESNPQLFREIKGRLKTRNVVIAAAVSVITQFVVVISLLSQLPDSDPRGLMKSQFGRYAMGIGEKHSLIYTKDLLDNWVINWQLLWLDLFITLSIISICSLLVFGTYMLIVDLVKEENRGTLNFLRLSPQSASNILLGKILGVPILIYTAILLIFPLHLVAGLRARIPLTLIIGFYAVIIASCAFFYTLALLWSLINTGLPGFKPWLASGTLGFLMFVMTKALFNTYIQLDNPFGWFFLFNPHVVLSYLIESTHLPDNKIDFLSVDQLGQLMFYGQALWTKASLGICFILFHFSVWTYWCWSILKRRFHNPENTLISKPTSYWLTGWLVVFALGFTLQAYFPTQSRSTFPSELAMCFFCLQFYLYVWGIGLIAALSPHRQALHDWSRYRHQVNKNGNVLWKELIFADNSPSTVAVAINLAMASVYIIPSVFLFLNDNEKYIVFWGFILSAGSILFCAVLAQLILTLKTRKRSVWSAITVALVIILPPLCLGFSGIEPNDIPQAWLFTVIPSVATEYATLSAVILTMLGQWLAISLVGLQMTKKLRQAGKSETKILLSQPEFGLSRLR